MRRGLGAEFPQHDGRGRALVAAMQFAPQPGSAQVRANIAKLFWEMRNALRLTPHQAAVYLQTRADVVEALEAGQFEVLPPWPETARIVISYAAMAGIDAQPLLRALGEIFRASVVTQIQPVQIQPVRSPQRPQSERLRHAGMVFANGAKRLPAGALRQVRERPERAFYTVSLPLAIVVLLLNTSVLQAAFEHVPRPVSRMFQDVRQFFQVQFAPIHEGLRWIDVDDPRCRRGDKLR